MNNEVGREDEALIRKMTQFINWIGVHSWQMISSAELGYDEQI